MLGLDIWLSYIFWIAPHNDKLIVGAFSSSHFIGYIIH